MQTKAREAGSVVDSPQRILRTPRQFVANIRRRTADAAAPALARWGWMLSPFGLGLGARLGAFIAADIGVRLLAPTQFGGAINGWYRADAKWYVAVATQGYNYSRTTASRVNFYPLYPLLIHLLSGLTGLFTSATEAAILAGMLISWLCFGAACVCLYRLTLDRFGPAAAYRTVLLVATFPFGFFFGAVYTESLFLLLAVLAFLAVERGWWGIAAGAAALAGAERPTGLLIAGCVVLAYALDRLRARKLPDRNALWLLLTPVGFLAFVFYCWQSFGDPVAFMTAERVGWGRGGISSAGVMEVLVLLRHPDLWLIGSSYNVNLYGVYAFIAGVFTVLAVWMFLRLGPVYSVYCLATIIAPLLTYPSASGLGRYLSVTFPAFIVGGAVLARRPALADTIAMAGAMLLGFFAVFFTLAGPIY